MKKILCILLVVLLLSACSTSKKEEQEEPEAVFVYDEHGEEVQIPILIEDLIFEDIQYYPLKGIEDYYGVQVRVSNKSEHIIEKIYIGFGGSYESKEYGLTFIAVEEEICQSNCTEPELSFYGDMYFKDSIEYLPRFMYMEDVSYGLKNDKSHYYTYNFIENEYTANIRY